MEGFGGADVGLPSPGTGRPLGVITWAAPLDWLEGILPGSPVLANLRNSLPRPFEASVTPGAIRTPVGDGVAAPLSVISANVAASPPELRERSADPSPAAKNPSAPNGGDNGVVAASPPSPSVAEEAAIFPPEILTAVTATPSDIREDVSEEIGASASPWDESASGAVLFHSSEAGGRDPSEAKTSILDACRSSPLSEDSKGGNVSGFGQRIPAADAANPSEVPPTEDGTLRESAAAVSAATPGTSVAVLPGIRISPLPNEAGIGASCVEGTAPAFRQEGGTSVTDGPGACAEVPVAPQTLATPGPNMVANKSTGTTPVSMASATTWTSPPSLMGIGVNTSPAEKADTRDDAAETDSLLWRCSRDQLDGLSRAELEGRLESSLIIMEALSHQLRALQHFRTPGAAPGPADQRDAGTQTPLSDPQEEEHFYRDLYLELRGRHQALQRSREGEKGLAQRLDGALNEMKSWFSDSGELLKTADTACLRLQDHRKSLRLQQTEMAGLLSRCREKLQSSGRKHAEMKGAMEEALRVKEATETALEAVRGHAGARIRCLEQGLDSRKRLHARLREANQCKAELFLEYDKGVEEMDRRATTLREGWLRMRLDYEMFTSTVARCLVAVKKRSAEAAAAREEVSQHREVCRKLEERTVEVVEALGRANALSEANAGLEKDLMAALRQADAAEREGEDLSRRLAEAQGTIRELEETAARLSREKEAAEQDRDSAQREARDASDCREFMEEENRIVRRQLAETEEELKSTLATLRQRSAQLEDLKDAHQVLQEQRESLRAELDESKAEIQSTGTSMAAFSASLTELRAVHSQFLEMADFLRAALRGEAADLARIGAFCTPGRPTPRRPRPSFVETVLQAAAEKDSRTPGLLSDSTAFTKATPARRPTPSEVHENFSTCLRDLCGTAAQLRLLLSQRHEATLEDAQSLQAEILQLKQEAESLESRRREEKEAAGADITRLNKALHGRIEHEKELQKMVRQQDERLQALSDQSWEIAMLREEASQAKQALQKSETEAAALWEELRGTKPSGADSVQEKIWLQHEVQKLRELLLRKDDERYELQTKHLSQVRRLEGQLGHAKQALQGHERTAAEVKEALLALLPEATEARQRLLDLLA